MSDSRNRGLGTRAAPPPPRPPAGREGHCQAPGHWRPAEGAAPQDGASRRRMSRLREIAPRCLAGLRGRTASRTSRGPFGPQIPQGRWARSAGRPPSQSTISLPYGSEGTAGLPMRSQSSAEPPWRRHRVFRHGHEIAGRPALISVVPGKGHKISAAQRPTSPWAKSPPHPPLGPVPRGPRPLWAAPVARASPRPATGAARNTRSSRNSSSARSRRVPHSGS